MTWLRWITFLALAPLVAAGADGAGQLQLVLLAVVAASNVALARLPPRIWEHPALLPIVAVLDIGVLTASMYWGQGFARDFFFAYFALLAVVAMAGRLGPAVVAATLVVIGYGTLLGLRSGLELLHSPELIGRLGFLFSVGVGYGGLLEAGKARLHDAALRGQLVGWVSKLSAAFADDFDAVDLIRQVLLDIQAAYPGNVRASLVQVLDGRVTVITSSDDEEIRHLPLAAEQYPELTRVLEEGRPVVIEDIRTSPVTEAVRELVADLPFTALLLCPVRCEQDGVGNVVLRVARKHGSFSPAMVQTTQNVAEAIGVIYRQATLREAMERSQRMEMVAQITASVAHSFNAILSTVLLSSETIRRQVHAHANVAACGVSPCDGAGEQRFTAIELAVKEGLTIVERLEAWTRLGSDQQEEADRRVVSPAELLQEAWRHAQPHWSRHEATRRLQLHWQVEDELPAVAGNPTALREALLNLILNAIDAMPRGGTLTLGADAGADEVRFFVQDTGTGIPEEQIERIFEPLFSTKGTGGTGLGLTIARQVATRHRGSLSVVSKEGIGSRFCLRLPAAACADPAADPPADGQVEDNRRVLLVEGNELVRDVMLRSLQGAGNEVDTVAGVDEALIMLGTSRSYAGLVVDADDNADLIALLEWLQERRPDLSGRVLVFSTRDIDASLQALQRTYAFVFVDRSAGLGALHQELRRITDATGEAAA